MAPAIDVTELLPAFECADAAAFCTRACRFIRAVVDLPWLMSGLTARDRSSEDEMAFGHRGVAADSQPGRRQDPPLMLTEETGT